VVSYAVLKYSTQLMPCSVMTTTSTMRPKSSSLSLTSQLRHQYNFKMSEDVWDQIFTILDTGGYKSISMDDIVDFL